MPATTATAYGQNGTGDNAPHQKAEVAQVKPVAPFVTRSKRPPTTTTDKPDRNPVRKISAIVDGVLPEDDGDRKSITLEGFLFKRDGVGWECRSVVYVPNPQTEKKERKRPYLAHLSRTKYEAMKAKNKTKEALTLALVEWAKSKQKEKAR